MKPPLLRFLARFLLPCGVLVGMPESPGAQEDDALDSGLRSWWSGPGLSGPWGGLRERWADQGILVEGSLIVHLSAPFSGGLEHDTSARHLLDVALAFDLETLFGWHGATLGLDLYETGGTNGDDDVGDLQGISNIDSVDRVQIAEAWYEHVLLDGRVRLKVGKVDVNSEFAFVDNGGDFTHPSSGISPAVALAAPTYPDPATSVNLFVDAGRGWSLGFGLYDGATHVGDFTGSRGPGSFFGEPSDLFLIAQLDKSFLLGQDLAGRVGIGTWRHTGDFDEFDGDTSDGTEGFYLVLDQDIWHENPADGDDVQGWSAFLMAGFADAEVSEVEQHFGVGLVRTGWIEDRPDDVLGLSLQRVELSDEAGFSASDESNLEFFYKAPLGGWCTLQPDLQFITHPGGDRDADDVWIAAVRLEIGI